MGGRGSRGRPVGNRLYLGGRERGVEDESVRVDKGRRQVACRMDRIPERVWDGRTAIPREGWVGLEVKQEGDGVQREQASDPPQTSTSKEVINLLLYSYPLRLVSPPSPWPTEASPHPRSPRTSSCPSSATTCPARSSSSSFPSRLSRRPQPCSRP